MKDWRGKEIVVGVLVVYPVRTGSWMEMKEGRVTKVVEETEMVKSFYGFNGEFVEREVDKSFLRVQKTRNSGAWQDENRRIVTVGPSRVTVVGR